MLYMENLGFYDVKTKGELFGQRRERAEGQKEGTKQSSGSRYEQSTIVYIYDNVITKPIVLYPN